MTQAKKPVSRDKYVVPAVEQAMRVLFRIAQSDSAHMNLTQICEQTGIHKSTAFCLLHTLRKYGIVQTAGRGKGYTLGPGLIGLSRRFLDTLSTPRMADPLLTDLAVKAGATTALGLIADRSVFVAAKHEGSNPLGFTMRVGHRFLLTYGCHGKAIAAFLPEEELDALIDEETPYFYGDPSKFNREKLMEDIAQCRRNGFAEDLEEIAPGLNAIAAPVIGPNQRPIGYIAVLGLASVEAVWQCGPLVAETAKNLSWQLGFNTFERSVSEPRTAFSNTHRKETKNMEQQNDLEKNRTIHLNVNGKDYAFAIGDTMGAVAPSDTLSHLGFYTVNTQNRTNP